MVMFLRAIIYDKVVILSNKAVKVLEVGSEYFTRLATIWHDLGLMLLHAKLDILILD